MKKVVLSTNIPVAILPLGLTWGCQSTAVGPSAASQKENLLVRSGFKAKTVTTPKQQQRVSALPAGKVSTVTYRGRLYYVYPTATKTGSWLAAKLTTMPTNRRWWHMD